MKHKLFTLKQALEYQSIERAVYIPGTRIRTTRLYTGGDDATGPLTGVILGYEREHANELNAELSAQGYTAHELYRVQFDGHDGPTVLWAEECELEDL